MKAIAAVMMAIGVACMAGAADESSRPPGVRTQDWIRIGDRLGFVLTASDGSMVRGSYEQILLAAPENVAADLMPPAKGYFVIQTPTGWRRIVIADPTELTR
jgi:hypothetical protein